MHLRIISRPETRTSPLACAGSSAQEIALIRRVITENCQELPKYLIPTLLQ